MMMHVLFFSHSRLDINVHYDWLFCKVNGCCKIVTDDDAIDDVYKRNMTVLAILNISHFLFFAGNVTLVSDICTVF